MTPEPRWMQGACDAIAWGRPAPGRSPRGAPCRSTPPTHVSPAIGSRAHQLRVADAGPTIDASREAALAALAESLDPLLRNVKVRRALAGDANTPPAVLDFIAYDPDDEVRIALLRNPSTPRATLFALARDPRLAPALATNPAASPVLLAALARHWDAGVRRRLALNPRTPRCTLAFSSAKPDFRSHDRTPRAR